MSWKLCLFSCSRLVVTKGAGRQLTAPQSIKVKFTKLPLQDLVCSNPTEGIHVQCSVHGSQKISFQEGFIGDVFYLVVPHFLLIITAAAFFRSSLRPQLT